MAISYNLNLVFVVFILALVLAGCSDNKAAPATGQPQAAPVFVSKAVLKSVSIQIEATGHVEAYSTVTVKAQVGGELTIVDFKEGADARKGDRLLVIDPRPYQTQVVQAEATLTRDGAQLQAAQANLARDIAQEEYARSEAKRYSTLLQKGLLAEDSAEQTNAQAKAAGEAVRADRAATESTQANIAVDQAVLERARLDLENCTIRSPIDGRTGQLLIKQGNVGKANDVDLLTINQLRPIYVTFTVPEADLSLIRAHMAAGDVPVEATLEGDNAVEKGKLNFVENTVDAATGTIRLKALFDNPVTKLWPGQFVRVLVKLNVSADSIIVPAIAVQTGQDGKFVFVVKPDMTVESRPVQIGRTIERYVVIEKGLREGETVVTTGQLRLVHGSRVEIKSDSSPATS